MTFGKDIIFFIFLSCNSLQLKISIYEVNSPYKKNMCTQKAISNNFTQII